MGPPHACATDGDGPVGPPPFAPPSPVLLQLHLQPRPLQLQHHLQPLGEPPLRETALTTGPPPYNPPPSHPHTPPLPPQSVTGGGARIGGERGGISGARAGGGAQKGSRPPPSRCAGRVPPWAAHCAGGVTRIGPPHPTPPLCFLLRAARKRLQDPNGRGVGWALPPYREGCAVGWVPNPGGSEGEEGGGDPPNTSREERGGNLPS